MIARPSHLQKVARCELRWLLDSDEATPAMRFGTAVHAVLEAYYLGYPDPPRQAARTLADEGGNPCVKSLKGAGWRSPAGRCAMAGLSQLPRPDRCEDIQAEAPAVIEGLAAGTRDLLVRMQPREAERLGFAREWLVVDYKTSSNPVRYAKTPWALRQDPQGIVYPYSAMVDNDLDVIDCRWLYLPSRAPYLGAVPTDFVQRRARVEKLGLPELRQRANRCLTIVRDPTQAARNPDACHDYNRLCPHHVDAGGFCNPHGDIAMGKLLDKARKMKGELPAEDPIETEGEDAEETEAAPEHVKAKPKATSKAKPAPGFEAKVQSYNTFVDNLGDVQTHIQLSEPDGAVHLVAGARVRVVPV